MSVTAKWWSTQNGKILCELCPRNCLLGEGQAGFCYIRYNENSVLKTRGWERSTGLAIDPIEKKPLYHVFPGSKILSLGTAGCNMGCRFCQNWATSKAHDDDSVSKFYRTENVVYRAFEAMKTDNNIGIAFTYNEPTIWAEWAYELAVKAKEYGLISAMITNAYITKQAVKDLYPVIDAANIDLKSFSENFYYKTTFSHLKRVLDAILWIKNEGTWIELTTLLVPGHNDTAAEIKEICSWVKQYCGEETPLHFTAFHPDYKMSNTSSTPFSTLKRAYDIGKSEGLKYVYTGNVFDEATGSTYCPGCSDLLIKRDWFDIEITRLSSNKCSSCGYEIKGIFGN
jgi:pyruvate formate lyase activating enzyme